MTLVFHVEEMVNSRLAAAVVRAVRALDLGASIRADPATQRLDVDPGSSDAEDVVEILAVAGFAATLTASAEPALDLFDDRSAPASSRSSGRGQ